MLSSAGEGQKVQYHVAGYYQRPMCLKVKNKEDCTEYVTVEAKLFHVNDVTNNTRQKASRTERYCYTDDK